MKYKFRCELKQDADAIKEALWFWVKGWEEKPLMLRMPDTEEVFASPTDLEVIVTLMDDGPSLMQIQMLINTLNDCRVAAQSIQLEENYTGARDYSI